MSETVTLPALPPGWKYQELDKLLAPKGISYGIVQPGNNDPDGVPIVRVKNIRRGRVLTGDVMRVSPKVENAYTRTRLLGGEVLLSLVGSVGEVAIAPAEIAGWNVARAVAVLRAASHVSSQWIMLCLTTDLARQRMAMWQNTTVQATLNLRDVRRLPIVVPPRVERDAIAAVLGALDDKIAINERIAATAVELAGACFLSAAAGTSPGPETFGSVATVAGGGTPSTKIADYWGGRITWATPTDVTALSAPYLFSTSRSITQDGLDNCASELYPAQSIFMTSRATIGAFALPQVPAAVNQGFIVVVPPTEDLRWWLFHEMRARVGEMIGISNGSTFLELSRKNFKAMAVRLVADDVMQRFAQTVATLHRRAAQAVDENSTLVSLRDTLLPKLMSGQITVKQAETLAEDVT
jgi:type I restriction enzyme S subunit